MLRISLTDRCNYRCVYCMPEEGVRWLEKDQILSLDELVQVAAVAADVHGIRRFKLTGGEPTLRPGLIDFVRRFRREVDVDDLSLTTNGQLLESLAVPLRAAGLDRVTVSVDSLRPDRFARITRSGDLATVMRGIDAALSAGFGSIKINCVVMRGTNDDELADFAALTFDRRISVRFIEYMPLGESAVLNLAETGPAGGCGGQQRGDVFVGEAEVRRRIESRFGELLPVARASEAGVGPASIYKLAGARGRIGFISAMSAPFCSTCNRLRLTAAGVMRSCLFDGGEIDLKPILRGGGRHIADNLSQAMIDCVRLKPDTHAYYGATPMSRIGG